MSPPDEAKAAGSTMCTRETCGDLHNAQANSGRSQQQGLSCSFSNWEGQNGGWEGRGVQNKPMCMSVGPELPARSTIGRPA